MSSLDKNLGSAGKQIVGPGGTQQVFDFTISNIVLMVGSQILLLAILLMIVYFGVPQTSFPANAVRRMVTKIPN